ncbi:uncharacterized protein KY384_003038 [Bacidia gigantensis]|uniref:uncharacterized protein n=1 Tax=Bacidia gigantensis TaxID=2732470 RepID=UPI001D03D6F4|nr:uncharacterized protein KY384_003038 [Bacidia gigantensis]KAG8531409.1 hypothetical protein KY384_003038 [Bacidia gigantensis]
MADPFSIAAGTVGLLDVSWRVGTYLSNLNSSRSKIEQELKDLTKEVKAIETANNSIQALWNAQDKPEDNGSISNDTQITTLWQNVGSILKGCYSVMERLQALVKDIVGNGGLEVTGKRDGVRKVLRKQGKETDVDDIRQQLSSFKSSLQLLLSALYFAYARTSQNSTDVSLEHLSNKMESLGFQLQSELTSLRNSLEFIGEGPIRDAIKIATGVASKAPLNRYFDIPRAVSSVFTGREKLLKELRGDVDPANQDEQNQQKRFVIYGLGIFWGVFYINASSKESAKHTYSSIAKNVGREPSEAAAKNFLTELDKPWLLIIDNADNPGMDLEDLFPGGERGVILITTRNPNNRVHGTFGKRFYVFEKLDEDAAIELILRTACESRTPSALKSATRIARGLSYLPLALVQAGKAVMKRLCSLDRYLDFYHRSWERIRIASKAAHQYHGKNDMFHMNVYSSYEILSEGFEDAHTTAAQDALDLLKVFSFMSNEEIRLDFLIAAVTHPRLENEHKRQATEKKSKKQSLQRRASMRRPLVRSLKEWITWAIIEIRKDRSRPVLPAVIRDDKDNHFDEDRLTQALDQLSQVSLISYQQDRQSYSMHPLIHTWIRERPEMSTGDQAIWCEAAITILTRSILLPPLDAVASAESLRRHLLPHVRHVRKYRDEIYARIQQNRLSRRKPLPLAGPYFGERQIWQLAKFSWVYFQNGLFDDAEVLQVKVQRFICENLGMSHPLGRLTTLALANTYWHQMRTNKAAELQEEVLAAHDSSLGDDHHQIFKDMDFLGASRCAQARFHEAKELHQKAISGLRNLLGPAHEDTLVAIDNLGRVMWRYNEYDEARILHQQAVDGLTECENIGGTHEKTLFAKECLALAHIDILGNLVRPTDERPHIAHELMVEVLVERSKKLGKEQPWTLLAKCDLARIKSALGDLKDAEQLLRETVPVAVRVLGENHFGTLMGKTHLAQMLARQKRHKEAETMFLEIIHRPRDEAAALDDGEHPDRILAMWYLVKCYEAEHKYPEALVACQDLQKLLGRIGGEGLGPSHPFEKRLELRIEQLGLLVGQASQSSATTSKMSLLDDKEEAHATAVDSKSVETLWKEVGNLELQVEQVDDDPTMPPPYSEF